MKRLLACALTACLLCVTALECFHKHASAHQDSCAACSLELQAAGVILTAPQVVQVAVSWQPLAPEIPASASRPILADLQARSPPLGA